LFCQGCGHVLEVRTAVALDEQRQGYDDMITDFFKDKETQALFIKKAKEKGYWEKIKALMLSRESGL
jgi:hypothetical protein